MTHENRIQFTPTMEAHNYAHLSVFICDYWLLSLGKLNTHIHTVKNLGPLDSQKYILSFVLKLL